jgi:hypothetical protein
VCHGGLVIGHQRGNSDHSFDVAFLIHRFFVSGLFLGAETGLSFFSGVIPNKNWVKMI